ncbi:MAG: hypothetical protein EOP04_29155, partial [Proteobacteria bacterium]
KETQEEEYIDNLYNSLEEELDLIHDLGDLPIKRLTAALTTVKQTLIKLADYVGQNPFENEGEEIAFFKHQKPKYLCEKYYALEKFTIETSRPLTDSDTLRTFYLGELDFIPRYFEKHQFLYQYFKFGFTELDHLLFLRGVKPSDTLFFECAVVDEAFETFGSELFARFMAYEKLQNYLIDELNSIGQSQMPLSSHAPGSNLTALKWSGETINLVELAYAIWLTGQVNNGKASVSEVVRWLEENLAVHIGDAHRRWQEIAQRKSVSSTKYLDEAVAEIKKRLDNELLLKQAKRRSK